MAGRASSHPEGKHKARLFESLLGITAAQAEPLRYALLQAVTTDDAVLGRRDEFGQRYHVDFDFIWQGRQARLRSGWIIEHGSAIPA